MEHSGTPENNGFRVPDIFIARDGVWYSDGAEVVHEKIFQLFNDNLHEDAQGGYYIQVHGQRCPVRVENTPFVVRGLFPENTADGLDVVWLLLNSGQRQALAPGTLHRRADGELLCTLENGMCAALSRHAATQLGQFLEQDDSGAFFISLNGTDYPL
jgi:hypothetical protein